MPRIPVLVTRHPVLCLSLALVVAAFFLIQIPFIQSMDNVDDISLRDDPDVVFYESIRDIFGDDEFFVIAFSSQDLFTPPLLQMVADITENLETIPEIREVQSLANVDYIFGAEEYFEVRPFLAYIPDDDKSLETLRQQALENPLYVGNLISADASATAIAVFPRMHNPEDGSFRKRLLEQTKGVLEEHQPMVGQFHLAGWTVTNFTLSQYMQADVAVFIPVTYLFITLTIWLVFRNVRLTLLALANISVCTGVTMGLFPVLGVTLNTVTTIVPPLVMALVLADTVHIFSHLDKKLLDQHKSPSLALEKVLSRVITPCYLTSLTTAVGFVSLAISDIGPIKDFAYVAAMGMLFKFFFSFFLLPPLILLCKTEHVYTAQGHTQNITSFLRRLADIVQAHPRRITFFVAILTVGALWSASTIKVETNLIENFKSSSIIRKDLDFVGSHLSGVATLDISLKAGTRDAFREPANLAVIERVQSFSLTLTGVDKTMSLVDFLKDMNMSFNDEDPAFYVIPETRELVSQYLLLYDSDDIDDFITPDYDHARILVRISEHSSAAQAQIIDELQTFLDQYASSGLQIRVSGRAVQDVNTIHALVWGQVQSLAIAAAVITLIMFLALRSVRTGALSLIPNIFPIVINFGIMGALGIPLNTATALISVVALGIAVDDTIHYLTEYNRRRSENFSIQNALRRATLDKGLAISVTSVILVIGFGVLLFSNFVPTISFGALCAVIMVTAWVGDLVVLPSLMLAFAPDEP